MNFNYSLLNNYTQGFVMCKFADYINSDVVDKNGLYMLKAGTSVNAWFLIFFHLVPILVVTGKHIFGIIPQERTTVSGLIDIFLYYILSPITATLLVKWQNQKLAKKPIKFRKKYLLVISSVLLIFVLLRISSSFLFKN